MGQQLFDAAIQLRGQSREHVLEVSPRIAAIEFDRLQQAHHDTGALAGQLAADEQPVAATDRNHVVILRMSHKKSRSSIGGTRFTGGA